jgi:hypothetical protein
MRLLLLALLLVFPVYVLRAEEPATGRAKELAGLVAPFVDHQTLAVIHADLASFDAVETTDALVEFFHLDADTRDFLQAEIAPITVVAQSLPPGANFDLFFVVSFSDLAKVPLFIVMPLEEGTPAAPVALEIRNGLSGRFRTEIVSEELHGALVTGTPQTLHRLKKLPPAPRPEIETAFAAVSDSELQVLIIPSTNARKALELIYPTLPASLGGGPTRELTQKFEWLAIGLTLPPNDSGLRAVVQSTSEEAAGQLSESIAKLVASLHQDSELEASHAAKLTERIVPAVEGARIVIDVTAAVDEVADYGTLLAPLFTMTQPPAKPAAK